MSTFGTLLALPSHAADRMIVLVLALCFDALVGDPPWLYRLVPHPVVLIGRAVALFERRLNRETRGPMALRLRGVFSLGWILELVLVAVLVAQRSLYDHVERVLLALQREGLEAGRQAVSLIVGRNPETLDGFGVAR